MIRIIAVTIAAGLLHACSVVPESAVKRDADSIKDLSNFEVCRAFLSFDLTNRELKNSPIPLEVTARGLSGLGCFEILMAEHGVDDFCSAYNRAVSRGEPSGYVGFATELSRGILADGLNQLDINCYTDEYVAKSAQRDARSARNADRVKEVFDSIEEGFKQPSTTTTRCRKTTYDTVECRETSY
ncbi:MAG: hypothetical protein HLX50_17535 [Alteromonadaceae bacterium]|nr:hypothetical protein [Alteromonadaceae bacterium]